MSILSYPFPAGTYYIKLDDLTVRVARLAIHDTIVFHQHSILLELQNMHCFNVEKLSFNRKLSHSHKHRPQKWRFWWQWTFEVDELYIGENNNSFCYIILLYFSRSHTRFPLRPRFTGVCYWFSFQTNILKFIWNSTTNVDYGRTADPKFSDHTTIFNL
jgi:hypothetical protein